MNFNDFLEHNSFMKKKEEKQKTSKKDEKTVEKSEKNAKKQKKTVKKAQKAKSGKGFLWFLGVSAMSVTLLVGCQLFFENGMQANTRFYENTKINGIDVGGMTASEAENVVLTNMLEGKKDIEIELTSKGKSWKINGNDFEVSNKIQPVIAQISKYGKGGNFFQNKINEKRFKEHGKDFQISYVNVLGNVEERLEKIVSEVEQESKEASLVFKPNEEEVFQVDRGQKAVLVNRDRLYQEIDEALKESKKVKIEIPIIEIGQDIDVEALKGSVVLRSSFKTNYSTSKNDRKENVKKALESFNGLIVEPGQTVSFNETTGPRTEENGYHNAHIIVGGVYVDGVGGGVCQASTTLYNALLLSDIEILSVNHHSLPASYVPLSFDAMVSGGYSDLVFRNNLENPIYIKTFADDKEVGVEIYGQKFDDGITIKRRAELVKVLPHGGDRIVADTKGEFSNRILYKGEYYRVKYPREGYESKGYLQYYKDGELVSEKEIRHDFYQPQDGVVMEGVETPAESMTIPASEVKIIKPQKVSEQTIENVKTKLEKTNPSEYNP